MRSLYSSQNIIIIMKLIRIRWEDHVARMGEKRNVCRVLVGKREAKRSQGRPIHRWENNIKLNVDINKIGLSGLNSSD
jgi:hypothetical protein